MGNLRAYKVRMFFRAIKETKNLDKANLIIHGDVLGGTTLGETLDMIFKLYEFTGTEFHELADIMRTLTKNKEWGE